MIIDRLVVGLELTSDLSRIPGTLCEDREYLPPHLGEGRRVRLGRVGDKDPPCGRPLRLGVEEQFLFSHDSLGRHEGDIKSFAWYQPLAGPRSELAGTPCTSSSALKEPCLSRP